MISTTSELDVVMETQNHASHNFDLMHVFFISLYSTRVSNELGAGHPQAARLAVFVVLVMAIAEGTLIGLLLILIRNIWGYAYSNEIEVVKYVAAMMPILALSNFLDGMQCVLSGFLDFHLLLV